MTISLRSQSRPTTVSEARAASGPQPLGTRRSPTPNAVLLVAAFGAFLAFLDSTIVNVAFPDIQRTFPESSLSTLSWVLNAYNIVLASFLVAAGRFADLLGRKRVFVVGVVVFTVASVLCAVAGTVGQLIACRVLQGFGAALLIPASLALVVEAFELSRRAHGVGLWGAAAAIASGLGPPVGGALVELSSWRLAFLVNLPLGIAAVVVAQRALVESRSPGVRKMPDLLGALCLAATLGLLSLGLIKGPGWGWIDLRTLATFVGSAAFLVGFVTSSRRHRSPLLDPALLRVRSFALGNVLSVVAGAGFYAYLLTHVLFLSYVWDYSLLRAGLAVAPAALVAAVVAAVLGKVADRRGHRIILVPGALLWAASLVLYLERVGPSPAFLSEWLPAQLVQGIGVGATLPVLGSAALARLPKGGGYATASAVVTSARQLGAVLGIALLVVLIGTPAPEQAQDALRGGWVFAACCFVLVAVGSALLGRTAYEVPPGLLDATVAVPLQRPSTEVEQPVLRDEEPAAPDSLADLPLFHGLPPSAVAALEAAAKAVELDAGEHLFHQGDPTDGLYVLRTGRLQVTQAEVVLTELTRGAVLGELGLLTGQARSASVRAVRDSRLVHLTRDDFARFATLDVMTSLARGLATRLQEIAPPATSRTRGTDVVVAVVALDEAAPVDDCAQALVRHLRTHLRVAVPHRVDREGLERAERDADRVLLTADGGDPVWRDLCLRVADRVVLVSGHPSPPAQLPARALGADLVLTGAAATRTQRAQWEALMLPRSTHVVNADTAEGMRGLAARLAGRSLGLVLAGGGARAFAHLGVLDELESAGIVVDRFAGASVGACIAALAASGADAAAVDAQIYEHFVRKNPIGDYTFPTKGLVKGRRTTAAIQRSLGDVLVEELPHEFRCVSVDLLHRQRVVHRSGRLADAVACSLRLPGLYPPFPYGGTLHVDGGVLANLPVSSLSREEGPLVAVNISFGGSGRPPGAPPRTGPPRVPALPDTLLRTMMLGSGSATEEALAAADLVLCPESAGVGLLEFHQIDRMREAGREATRAALPQLTALVSR